MNRRIFIIIFNGLGVWKNKNEESTLQTICRLSGCNVNIKFPTLNSLGLLKAINSYSNLMIQKSISVGSLEGVREYFGFITKEKYLIPTNPIPDSILEIWSKIIGKRVIGNKQGRGKNIIPKFIKLHHQSGALIIYRGLDSSIIISADVRLINKNKLYYYSKILRDILSLNDIYKIKTVIAKPLINGKPISKYIKCFYNKYNFNFSIKSLLPTNWEVIINQKVADILCDDTNTIIRNLPNYRNIELIKQIQSNYRKNLLLIFDLDDFDNYAHKRNVNACIKTLEEMDKFLSNWLKRLNINDWFIFTADHGVKIRKDNLNRSHSLEGVPIFCYSKSLNIELPVIKGYDIVGKFIKTISNSKKNDEISEFLLNISSY